MDSTPQQASVPKNGASTKRSIIALLSLFFIAAVGPMLLAQSNGLDTTASARSASGQTRSVFELIMVWLPAAGGVGLGVCVTLLAISVRKWLRSFRKKIAKGRPGATSPDSSGRYEALFENANDLIQGIALHGKLLYANTAWHDLLDYNEQEMKELTIFDIVSPDALDAFKSNFYRATVGVKIKSLETTFVSKYGKRVIVEGSLHAEL